MLITLRYISEIPDCPASGIRYPDVRGQMTEGRSGKWECGIRKLVGTVFIKIRLEVRGRGRRSYY